MSGRLRGLRQIEPQTGLDAAKSGLRSPRRTSEIILRRNLNKTSVLGALPASDVGRRLPSGRCSQGTTPYDGTNSSTASNVLSPTLHLKIQTRRAPTPGRNWTRVN